jgi:uncharacterized protein (TIGR02246 family)
MEMKALFLFTTISFLSFGSRGQSSQDEQSVKKVVISFQEDFNDGGFKNAAAYSSMGWEHINPGGGITKGRNEVLKEVRAVHQTFLKGVSMQIESISIRFITPSVAIADVIHKMTAYTTPDGERHENERQIKTYVIARQKGNWLLVQDHNTVVQGSNTATNEK